MIPNQISYCVIMAGGFGTRFWPLSRENSPKQFLDILGNGKTMIQETAHRLEAVVPFDHFMVVTGEQFEPMVLQQLPAMQPTQVLTEPERRNTAPAIAYAAYRIAAKDPDAIMVVTPSDHYIGDEVAFRKTLNSAIRYVHENNVLLTIGIRPTFPSTAYGYLEMTDSLMQQGGAGPIKAFKEKPDEQLAKEMLASGRYLWNSGMFVWKVRDIIDALEQYLPEVAICFAEIDKFYKAGETECLNRAFEACPSISIDYGVMEKAKNVYTIIGDFDWADVGSWTSLHDLDQRTGDKRTQKVPLTEPKKIFGEHSTNTLIRTTNPNKQVVAIGLNDYVVLDTEEVLFIAPKSDEQKLNKLIEHFSGETDLK